MKPPRLSHSMMKAYLFFMLLMGVTSIGMLLLALRFTSATLEVGLGWLLSFLALHGLNVWLYKLWTARTVARPLEGVAEGIREMAEGRYGRRLDYKGSYEITVIQEHLNAMSEALERAEAENRRLEESRSRLLADLSHDLKTPVTTIQGYAHALRLGMAENESKRERYLELISQKSAHLTALIEDLTRFSSLDSPDYPLSPAPSDLVELVRELAAEYYELFAGKKMPLTVDLPRGSFVFAFDTKLVRRAISNLLSNTLNYGPSGTEVVLRLRQTGGLAELTVADHGGGIAEPLASTIFDPFVRGDDARGSRGGTGLGLSIARKTAELHGGTLELVPVQGRTVFRFTLRIGGEVSKQVDREHVPIH